MRNEYRFVLELRELDGGILHQAALVPDWEPAVEWTRLMGLRAHGVWGQTPGAEPRLEPLWHGSAGEPAIEGFRVHLAEGGRTWFADFRMGSYFAEVARTVAVGMVADGRLQAGDRVRFGVTAFADDTNRDSTRAVRFDTSERPGACVVRERSLAKLAVGFRESGESNADDIEMALPEGVLDEVCTLTRNAGPREIGGVLLGHLYRDPETHEVGVEVTAQIPARHTVGDAVRLTFTSDTWTDVRAAVELRRTGELMVGWWHSHPAREWCKECPLERQHVCQLATGFMSPEDRVLHRAMFPGAFTAALVVTDSARGLDSRLFGWRRGVLEPRGFRIVRVGGQATHASLLPALAPGGSHGPLVAAECAADTPREASSTAPACEG